MHWLSDSKHLLELDHSESSIEAIFEACKDAKAYQLADKLPDAAAARCRQQMEQARQRYKNVFDAHLPIAGRCLTGQRE